MRKSLFFILLLPAMLKSQVTWQQLPTPPINTQLYGQSFLLDSSFYIEGGVDSSAQPVSSMWQYDINAGTWQQKDSFLAMHSGSGCVIGDTAYLLSGWLDGQYLRSFWRYEQAIDSWTLVGPMPLSTVFGSTFTAMGRLFTGFGYDTIPEYLNNLWEYDFASGTWQARSPKPNYGIDWASVAVVDSFAYVIGALKPIVIGSYISTNDFWRYNVNQNHWDSLPVLPDSSRTAVCLYSFKNFLLVAFGQNINYPAGNYGVVVNSMYRFDFGTSVWSPVSYTGDVTPSASGTYFQYGTKCYLYGGLYGQYLDYGTNLYVFDAAPLDPILDTTASTGIKPVDENSISISPNPVSDKLHINSSQTNFSISISNMAVQSWPAVLSGNEIDVSALPAGVYCLRLQNVEGSIVKKFVKE